MALELDCAAALWLQLHEQEMHRNRVEAYTRIAENLLLQLLGAKTDTPDADGNHEVW